MIGVVDPVFVRQIPLGQSRVGHRLGDQAERVPGLDLDHAARVVDVGRVDERVGGSGGTGAVVRADEARAEAADAVDASPQ